MGSKTRGWGKSPASYSLTVYVGRLRQIAEGRSGE